MHYPNLDRVRLLSREPRAVIPHPRPTRAPATDGKVAGEGPAAGAQAGAAHHHSRHRRREPSRTTGRITVAASLLFALFGAATPAQTPTRIAQAQATDFPDTSGRFEASAVTQHSYAPSWAPWVMSPFANTGGIVTGAGIAANGAPFLMQSNATPEGTHVAFLEGLGSASCSVAFAPGTWRLRFFGAQRRQGSVADAQRVAVEINGQSLFEQTLAGSAFTEYVTEPFRVPTATTLLVTFRGLSGQGGNDVALFDRVLLDRVQSWSATSTWGAAPPTANDDVLIEANAVVAMAGACTARSVVVRGTLLAARALGSLTSHWVLVTGRNARFVVGTEALPFAQTFTLELNAFDPHENDQNPSVMQAGTKFLMAMDGGRIDMHGTTKKSWSKLTAVMGAGTVIRVADPVTWSIGDEIVVASSALAHFDGSMPPIRSEVRTIVSVDPVTGDIGLNQALAGQHVSSAPVPLSGPTGGNWVLDQRAEVGLLTHNVRIQGDIGSSASQFGAHVMLMNCALCNSPGFGRFTAVQMTRMGQKGLLGRYPIHWHMQRANGQGQYLRSSSIRESYNRAITIHGSDYVTVEDNVAFDHLGHGVFLEDGGEQYNRILRNLVLGTRRPTAAEAILQTDHLFAEAQNRSPAVFWITNPNNEIVGNVAADCVGTGYWFALHQNPFGLSAGDPYFAGRHGTSGPLGAFRDNVCHSCGTGIDLNDSVHDNGSTSTPTDDFLLGNVGWLPLAPVTLDRFTAHACATAMYAGAGSDKVTFTNVVSADNEWHVQFACPFEVTKSVLVEDSGNSIFLPVHAAFSGQAFVVYDGPARLTNSHLVGFDGLGAHPYGAYGMVVTSVFGAAMRHTNHLLSGLTFQAGFGTPNVDFNDFAGADPQHQQTFSLADARHWGIAVVDADGSLSAGSYAGRTLVTNHPMMHIVNANGATPDATYPHWDYAWLSPFQWGHLVILHLDANNFSLLPSEQPDMLFSRNAFEGWRGAAYMYDFQVDNWRQMPLVVRRPSDPATREVWYTVDWAPPGNARKVSITMDDLGPGDVTRLRLRNANGWSNETVVVGAVTLTPVASVAALDGLPATAYARTGTQDLWLRIVATQGGRPVVISWP